MKYHLSFNEKLHFWRIEETGCTLTSRPDDADYKQVASSDSLKELRDFVGIVQILRMKSGEEHSHEAVVLFWETRFQTLEERVFAQGDF